MNKLSNYLVEQILLEDTSNPIKRTIVVYPGRFQPFHAGHYVTYQNLVNKFGKDNVFIGTSNKVEKPKSPFNFKEKVNIMTTMFGIPKKQIVEIKIPYKPTEILSKFDENTTAFVTVVGKKDANRLGGKYFEKYNDNPNTGYRDKGYVYVSPVASELSGTDVRNHLSMGNDESKKEFFTKKAYPKFNQAIFNLVTDKLSESFVIEKETIEEWLLNESTRNTDGNADDGPAGFFPNMTVFNRVSVKRAQKIGYDVINMIMNKDLEDYYEHPEYPNGPVKAVSFYPAGVIGHMTPNNQIDIYSSDAYTEWYKHVTRRASLAGYELITTQLEKAMQKKLKSLSGKMAQADKAIEKEFELFVNESITIPVEIGDTVLMGKFKNKKVVVKNIGKDEHGMPTINGKKVVTFRLVKENNEIERVVELDESNPKDILTEANKKLKINIPANVKKITKAFKKNGKKVYIVGGAVRDAILGKTPHDFDLTTDAKAHEMVAICDKEGLKHLDTHIIYGTVIIEGEEVTQFRKDIGTNRKLDGIDYTDIEGDVRRRDLTVNALFYDIDREEIVDLVGGIQDLMDKKIRTVGKAADRFEEDHLRKLRAIRFTVKLGGTMDPETLLALKQDPTLKDVSENRIRQEFIKSVESAKSTKIYLDLMEKLKFLPLTFPGLRINKPYVDESDYIVLMAYLLKKNSKSTLETVLNKLNYTKDEITDVNFLISMDDFTPDKIVDYKKDQKRTKLTDKQIVDYGKHNNKDYSKFVKFNTSVSGKDAPKDIKGKEIGTWINDEEKRKFLNEMAKKELNAVEKFADKKLDPTDVTFTKHFFDRLNDPRNGKEITYWELISFFNRLTKDKKELTDFLKKYKELVITDKKTKINMPLVSKTNQIIAKTVMRKDSWKTSNPVYTFESINEDTFIPDIAKKPKVWYRLDTSEVLKISDNIIDLIQTAYSKTKDGSFVNSKSDIQRSIFWNAIDVDGNPDADAVLFGRKTKFGIKIQGIGHDGERQSKEVVIKRLTNVLKTSGYWVEASDALESVLYKSGVPYVTSEKIGNTMFPDSDLKMLGNKGQYTRKLQNGKEVKETIFGNPKVSVKDSIGEIYDDINEMLDSFDSNVNETHITEAPAGSGRELSYLVQNQYLPIFSDIMEKIIGKQTVTAIHVTDVHNYKQVENMQGSTRAVSTVTNLKMDSPMMQNKGLRTLGGVFIALEGTLLLRSAHDVWSSIDVDGRKWVKFSEFFPTYSNYEIDLKRSLNNNSVYSKYIKKVLKSIPLSNEESTELLKNYIQILYSFMLKYKTQIREKFTGDLNDLDEGKWNELLIDNITIKDVLVKLKDDDNDTSIYTNTIGTDVKITDDINDVKSFITKYGGVVSENINETLIMEGGTWGHMNHPFDTEVNLTFGQLKDIVDKALDGKLEFTREKTDGQGLSVSWKNGKLIAARNKGHLKNRGENALDINGIADKFQGRGGLTDAYNFAMKDLSKAIGSLSDKQKEKIFAEGSKFMQIEVIFPTSVNVIPYGQALLVFHGTYEYDLDGNIIGESTSEGKILAGMIKQINQHVQDNYTIQGPPVIELPKNEDLSKKKSIYKSKISKLQKEFGLKDTDGVADYHQAWWTDWINKNSPTKLDDETLKGLVKRWAFFDKSFRLDSKTIPDEKTLQWAQKHEKDNHKKISKDNLMKFEDIFLGLGAEVLQFTTSVLTVNPDKALRDMKKRLDQTIKDIKKSGDEKNIEKLKLELRRLNSIGGVDKIVPSEGIVFVYNGNTMKLTGTFASLNQLLGIFYT